MLLQLRLQFMSAMLVFYILLIPPPYSVDCSTITTIINASSQNTTIPSDGNSHSLNKSTTLKPYNLIQTESIQKSVSVDNRTNVVGVNATKLNEKPTPKSVIKLYNKADPRKRKMERKSIVSDVDLTEWHCPNISQSKNLDHLCSCDMPHTLRCSGDIHSLETIAEGLRASPYPVSLLDCTLKNVSFLSNARIFENCSILYGLVISSGEIKRVHRSAFLGIKTPLQALGLPNNALAAVPYNSLAQLTSLDRLDLSNNKIKTLGASDFLSLQNLTYLELSDNQISGISLRTFNPLKKLITLKLNGNRLGDFTTTLQSIGQSLNLRELDLRSNSIKGPLTKKTLPALPSLESLNLDRNLLSSIQNGALLTFPYLVTLSLRHNQIDVLQDHAFSGLSSLQSLDSGYNGIVAVSGASLLHLSKLLVLDLTHNFLRALTSDLIAPLPALRELRLDGNDISIVARNALNGANELHSLSLQDNPLSCDCMLKPFAEWLTASKIPANDLLGAICATPPHLEGAPLLQIPVAALNCDGATEYENSEVLEQLDIISKQSNLSYSKELTNIISLKNVHLSEDYGIILTWTVNLQNDEFKCDAVFVYKETNVHEILLDNSPVEENPNDAFDNAKPYTSIPGPSRLELIKSFVPGGKFHKKNFLELNSYVYKTYGPIVRFPGLFGNFDNVFIFDPKDIETVFRNEGPWPFRKGLATTLHYRETLRPDIFKNSIGLVNDQGEPWFKLRTAVNPIMMKPKVVNAYIQEFDTVAKEFVDKVWTLRDDKNEMPDDFQNELFRWALESISLIALEQRLGLLSNAGDPDNMKIINAVKTNLALSYELDVEPSIWKFFKTPKYRKLMNSLDTMTNVSKKQIDKAIDRLATQSKRNSSREESVLEKVLQIDEGYAMVMSLDMLSAGIHSTVAATAGLLYNLANNQRAQDKLREEAFSILPTAETPLTTESFTSLPYLRACLKESMRRLPVFSGNFRGAGRNMVIKGYQIPAETHLVLGAGTIVNNPDFVERPDEFIPERFLKDVQAGCPNSKDIHPFLLVPFGFGPRHCVGKRFAEMEIEILMMRILTKYKFEWNYGPLEFSRQLVILPSSKLKYKITSL